MVFTRKFLLFCVGLLWLFSCSKRNYNVDAETALDLPDEKTGLFKKRPEPVALADTAKPQLNVAIDTTALANVKHKNKKRKKKKKEFLGYQVKKGFTKTGSGKNATIEIFYYLPKYVEPSQYAPAKYYYSIRRKRILRGTPTKLSDARIPHGPYKKLVGKQVVTEGYHYLGTRHLRWETYNRNNILLTKTHYEKGFQRDAIVNYYDAAKTKIKEVIPYSEGKIHGEYVSFLENGLKAWEGQYEAGKKVGVWIEYWPFRNRKHFEYQYPEAADAEPFEPYLLREYDRHSTLIYEHGKLDKRPAAKQ
ncbi:MAG: toxin-antitoxin system YwqK family antitoxin [Adhaeribacter sp.]